jgi:cytochrome-b5 reductase
VGLGELQEHSSAWDAWICVRGIVYDVTDYGGSHPGGKNAVFKGAGKDCTAGFVKAHAWVRPESLIKNKIIGVLEGKTVEGSVVMR